MDVFYDPLQVTANFRRMEEERAAKMKQEIYIRERKAVHEKYKVSLTLSLTFLAFLCE